MSLNAQISVLEDLLTRARKNRITMERDRSAAILTIENAPEVVLLPIPSEPPPAITKLEATQVIPPVSEPKPVLTSVAEPKPVAKPVLTSVAEPKPVAKPVLTPVAEPLATESPRVVEPVIAASLDVIKLQGTREKSWTLNAVLDRAWKLGK